MVLVVDDDSVVEVDEAGSEVAGSTVASGMVVGPARSVDGPGSRASGRR